VRGAFASRVALLSCLVLGLLGCAEEPSGPLARVARWTGCAVPAGAVRVYDHLAGDARTFVMHAKVVLPKSRIGDFLSSCGFSVEELRRGYDPRAMAPREPLRWWNPPEPEWAAGAVRVDGDRRREILVVERDTDFAVFLRATGVAPYNTSQQRSSIDP